MYIYKNSKYLLAPLFLGALSTAHAASYTVLEGTFFMAGVTGAPIAITATDTSTISFTDAPTGNFDGSFCAANASVCSQPSVDSSATNNGLETFIFFGQPVYTYFSPTGIDSGTHNFPSINTGSLTADMGSMYANWNTNEFNQGNASATVVDNFDCTYNLTWDSLIVGGAFDGFTGSWYIKVKQDGCTLDPGEAADLRMEESGVTTRTVLPGDTVDLYAEGLATGTYVYTWDATDDAIDSGASNSGASNTVNLTIPGGTAPGKYNINVNVERTDTVPHQVSETNMTINVVASGSQATIGDTDNDGIQNISDGIDNTTTPTLLQTQDGNDSTYIITSSAGSLKIGRTAFCSDSQSAGIVLADITNNGNSGCSATTNSMDNTNAVSTGIGGYVDFEVHELALGVQVDVVLPVGTPLPKYAGYRTFTVADGWQPFDTTGSDSVASATGSSGTCPASTSSEWRNGLTEGHNCIRLSITDGGSNDADGLANGKVIDPGTISGYEGIDTNGVTVGGGWWFLTAFPLLFGLRRFKLDK